MSIHVEGIDFWPKNISNSVSLPWKLENPYYHRQHDGGPYGVSPDLAEKLAEKLGIGVELIPFEGPGVLADALNDNGMVHQIVSPISNSESTNFFNEYLLWFLFQLASWEEKKMFWTNKIFFFYFNCSNWEKFMEKFVKQIGENIWWIL